MSDKNVFYVIKRSIPNHYAPARGTWAWVKTPQASTRYATLLEAVREFSDVERKNGGPVFIVRVTETPGTTERRIVSTTKIDATKPVVMFNVCRQRYSKQDGGVLVSAESLQHATVYADLSDALYALVKDGEDAGRYASRGDIAILDTMHIHQVETITTPSTFTETEVA